MKKQLHQLIESGCKQAVEALYGAVPSDDQIQVQRTRKEFEGDLTLVVFPLLKITGKGPESSGEEIGQWLQDHIGSITGYNVVKGFLNLVLTDSVLLDGFNEVFATDNYGHAAAPSGGTVMVEYASPNTNKPLHLGHLRNIFLGYSVARIQEALGHEVVKVQVINDRGIHICKSMLAWKRWGEGETPASAGIKGDHFVGKYYVKFDQEYKKEIALLIEDGMSDEEAAKKAPLIIEAQEMLQQWEKGAPEVVELWKTMNGWVYEGFDATYERMGVGFDRIYHESETYILGRDKVMKGLNDGHFYQKEDGSVWADLEPYGLDHKLVLRADGTAVYITQDIGTAINRFEDYPNLKQLVYTVGNEQEYHFKVLFLILEMLGFEWAKECYHLSYGMVELPSGKMKSREGTVVDADDIMDEVVTTAKASTMELGKLDSVPEEEREALFEMLGLGALKYFLLKVDPKKGMMFDPAESVDLQGNTGPFIQYAHARISSILAKAGELPTSAGSVELLDAERDLIHLIAEFPEVIREAGENLSPALLANYVYDLVKAFNHFYQTIPILKEEDEAAKGFRVMLCAQTGRVIATGMELLGISVPERM